MAKPIDGKRVTSEYAKHLRKYGKKQSMKTLRQKLKIRKGDLK